MSAILCAAVFSIILIMVAPAAYGQASASVDNIYVTNAASDSVQVLNSKSGSVVATISDVGSHPHGIILSPDHSTAYVAVTDPGTGGSTIVCIDTASNGITKRVPIPGAISDMAVTQDGKYIYVLAYDSLIYVDTSSGKLTYAIELPQSYTRVSVGSDDNKLFIAAQPFGMAYFYVDGDGGHMHYLGGWHGSDIVPSADVSKVYLADTPNSTIIVTDGELAIDAATVSTADYGHPQRILLSPDGSKLYAFTDSHKVIAINVQSNAIVNSWDLGDRQPREMANAPDGQRLYITCDDSANSRGTIAVIDMAADSVSDIFTGSGIEGIAAKQVSAAVTATPTPTATLSVTATPTIAPTGVPTAGTTTVSPQASATQTPSPSNSDSNSGICPLIPISFAGLILLGLVGRRKNQ
jgi:YVTN family beta-propeller protein